MNFSSLISLLFPYIYSASCMNFLFGPFSRFFPYLIPPCLTSSMYYLSPDSLALMLLCGCCGCYGCCHVSLSVSRCLPLTLSHTLTLCTASVSCSDVLLFAAAAGDPWPAFFSLSLCLALLYCHAFAYRFACRCRCCFIAAATSTAAGYGNMISSSGITL